MADNNDFKIYNPLAQLIATGVGGGSLPLTGGILTGNLTMQVPSKITQCELATAPCDVVNKLFLDNLLSGGPFLPLSGGTLDLGAQITQTTAPTAPEDTVNKLYVDSRITLLKTPNATQSATGKAQLAGDLSGIATSPTIANGVVTNSKLAVLSGVSELKGSGSGSNAVTDISLSSNLSIIGKILDVNTSALTNIFMPQITSETTGIMGGIIKQALLPIDNDDLANKEYVTSQISGLVPDATQSVNGKVRLAGDLNGTGSTASSPKITNNAITNIKMANMSGSSQLKGSSSTDPAVTDIIISSNLTMTANQLNITPSFLSNTFVPLSGNVTLTNPILLNQVPPTPPTPLTLVTKKQFDDLFNALPTFPLQVSNGGTGISSITGYILGNGINPFTSTELIPASNIFGIVQSVNGVFPTADSGGNVNMLVSRVITGPFANRPPQPQPDSTIYVVANDGNNNGNTYISLAGIWYPVGPNFTSEDGLYVKKIGDSMNIGAVLDFPNNFITLDYIIDYLSNPLLAINLNAFSIILARSNIFGTIKFDKTIGDFDEAISGVGVVKQKGVTNNKIQFGPSGTLKGTVGPSVTDIIVGSGLTFTGTTLSTNVSSVNLATDTTNGIVIFSSPPGDLIANSPGIANVNNLAITNNKINPSAAINTLKGTNSNNLIDDIALGPGLIMSNAPNPILSINTGSLQLANNNVFGTIKFDPSGDLIQLSGNPGIALIKDSAITNLKLAPGANLTFKGSVNTATNIGIIDVGIGTGISFLGNTVRATPPTLVQAGQTIFGTVKFSTTSGDLIQTSLNSGIAKIKPGAITNVKIKPGPLNSIKVTDATNQVIDYTFGPSWLISSSPFTISTPTDFMNAPTHDTNYVYELNPNIYTSLPKNYPNTPGVLYYSNNTLATWVWNGTKYVTQVRMYSGSIYTSGITAMINESIGFTTSNPSYMYIYKNTPSNPNETVYTTAAETSNLPNSASPTSNTSGVFTSGRNTLTTTSSYVANNTNKPYQGDGGQYSFYSVTTNVLIRVVFFKLPNGRQFINILSSTGFT